MKPKKLITIVAGIITLIVSIYQYPAFGSEKQRQLHISIPGVQSNAERDLGYSPLIYKGMKLTFSSAYAVTGENKSDLIRVKYSLGNLSNKWDNKMKVHTASIQTYKFYHWDRDPAIGTFWGWSNKNEFSMRDVDGMSNFNGRSEYFTSFGPALRIAHPFILFDRQFHFETLAHLQLLGFKIQSSYVTSMPPGFEDPSNTGFRAFLRSIEVFYPGLANHFGIQPALRLEFRSGNLLGIGYDYEYLWMKSSHTVEKSRGTWYIEIIAKL